MARLTQERGRAQADLALEKAAKAELEMRGCRMHSMSSVWSLLPCRRHWPRP